MTTETWTPGAAPPETLEWGPVRLDRWHPDDLDDQYAAVDGSRDHLAPFMPWSHGYERTSSDWYLADCLRSWASRSAFNYRVSAPTLAAGPVLGSASLMARNGPGSLEIGYWVRADAVRRGIARRASAALTEAGLGLPGV
ncbi:MAG TPA: GNAT family N-acetyltransferase, partial [Sporichthya sp.]|nr:GNAT family N-acetyltransferase [Sporichthya sp.]